MVSQELDQYGFLRANRQILHGKDDNPEEDERGRRSLERRIRDAHLGSFKPLCDFDWAWPKRCDRAAVEELMAS